MAHPNKHPLCRPWTSAELENLSQYAAYTDSIATIRSLLIARRDPDAPMPNAPIVWQTNDRAKWISNARVAAVYLTFAAWEQSEARLFKSLRVVLRARDKLHKKWRSAEFRNRGPKTEIEKIDRVIAVFVKSRKGSELLLQPDVFDNGLQERLREFYLPMPDIEVSEEVKTPDLKSFRPIDQTRTYNRSEPTPRGGPVCPAWMTQEIYDFANQHRFYNMCQSAPTTDE
jgi:hypothetical protein